MPNFANKNENVAAKTYHHFSVALNHHHYPIHIDAGCFDNPELLQRYVYGSQVMVVTNETVAALYLKPIQFAFTHLQCNVVLIPDGEIHKNQQSLNLIYEALIQFRHQHDTTLLALGGGVIGDITGFAAATYQRGVHYVQLPTTLLAQVDASVGGKTAINHSLGKNLIGSFYHPDAVIIDLNTLTSLPERELHAGFSEIIKYGLLTGGALLKKIYAFSLNVTTPRSHYAMLIAECCQLKVKFIQNDEQEKKGCRVLLNLGHTFAHALESCTHFQRWLHGEAVAIGLYCAALLSYQRGYLDKKDLIDLDTCLMRAQLPNRIPKDIDLFALLQRMYHDKKNSNNRLHLVLLTAPGNCYLDDTVSDEEILSALSEAVERT